LLEEYLYVPDFYFLVWFYCYRGGFFAIFQVLVESIKTRFGVDGIEIMEA